MKKVTVKKLTVSTKEITETMDIGDSEFYVRPANKDEKEWFEACHKNFNVLGFLVTPFISKVILKPKQGKKGFTPYGCVRDCGDHYIIAQYASYRRIDKKTGEAIDDVEDK